MRTLRWVGDRALLRSFAGGLVEANRSVRALVEALRGSMPELVDDVVPGARSVLVVLREGVEPSRGLLRQLERDAPEAGRAGAFPPLDITVAYGGEEGPDLPAVAALAGIPEAEVVRRHAAPIYVVAFIGFSPGFPYLIGLDRTLAAPRLAEPRTRVPAGSVGIGGQFTGIYPRRTPGGWRLIGRTSAELFDPHRDPPALLRVGGLVRFVPA